MKKRTVLVTILALLAILLIGPLLWSQGNEAYKFDPAEVDQIVMRNGTTGDTTICTEEDTEQVLALFNDFRYVFKSEVKPTSGWTYGVTIFFKNGEYCWIYLDHGSAKTDDTVYFSRNPFYFSDFIKEYY